MVDHLDLRRVPAEEAAGRLDEAWSRLQTPLLVRSFRPLPPTPTGLVAWPLVDGPSAFFSVYSQPRPQSQALDRLRQDHLELARLYHSSVKQALAGEELTLKPQFQHLLIDHLKFEEDHLFGLFSEVVDDERLVRELGYEHQGIRQGLEAYPDFLDRVLGGCTKKERDSFEIDFFHLIEHHVEREEKALYPLLETLVPERLRFSIV